MKEVLLLTHFAATETEAQGGEGTGWALGTDDGHDSAPAPGNLAASSRSLAEFRGGVRSCGVGGWAPRHLRWNPEDSLTLAGRKERWGSFQKEAQQELRLSSAWGVSLQGKMQEEPLEENLGVT